jgi:hypothetical protein
MKYLVIGPKGEEVARRVLPDCSTCFSSLLGGTTAMMKCPADRKNRRVGVIASEAGKVCLCSSIGDDLNSSRVFRARLHAFGTTIPFVQETKADLAASYNQQLNRVTHNLTSLNAHCIQELFALVPQDTLTMNITQQIKVIQDAMKASPLEAAKTFLRIAKNNRAMKLEFVAMRFLDDSAPRPVFREHQIQKVVLNVLHAFFQDFNERGVHVTVEDSDTFVMLDYDTFHVALYHIIDNATKYVMPRSRVTIRFASEQTRVNVVFEMLSLAIPAEEVGRIGEEGFSGSTAKHLQLAGHGMGMFRTRRLMKANDGELIIKANVDPSRRATYDGIEYEQNQFVVCLSLSPKRRILPRTAL